MKIMLKGCRLAFPKLFIPDQVNGEGQAAYSAQFIIPGDDPQADAINGAIETVAQEKWGAKAKAILAAIRGKDATCLHNGDLKAEYEGFEGNYFISARNQFKPLVIDRDREALNQNSGKPYAGCYVVASIDIYAQDNKFGKRVNATLRGVQFVKDGDAFAASPPAKQDEFDDISDQGDEDYDDRATPGETSSARKERIAREKDDLY